MKQEMKLEIRNRLIRLLSQKGFGVEGATIAADHLVANGVTVQEWIPVSERLPENEQDVLIAVMRKHYAKPEKYIQLVAKAFHTDGKHDTEHSSYVWNDCFENFEYDEENDAYKIPEGWWESVEYGDEFQAVDDFVTHWMPLPELPKEEAE